MDISYNEFATQIFVEYLEEKNFSYTEAKTYEVTYDIKYKREFVQDNGIYTWRYNMVKTADDAQWQIESFGF